MTEKNTLSILQNIKKKMQKFDQEPKKIETVAGVNDEFEYIPSSKAKSEVADNSSAVTASASAAATAAEIDKDLQSAENSAQAVAKVDPVPQVPVAAPTNNIEDDLGLDDLSDLEDHQVAAPAPKAPPAPVKVEEVVAAHDDLDLNLDLDLDLDLDEPEPAQTKAPEPEVKKPEEKKTEQQIDDLDLDKLLAEEEAAHKQAQQPAPAKPATPQPSQEIDIDDEEFLKDISTSAPAKTQAPQSNQEIDIDDEEFLKDISAPAPAKTQTSQPQKIEEKKSITDELLDDVDLNELDDIEDKMFAATEPTATAQAQEKDSSASASQDILEKELGIRPEEKKEEIVIPPLDMSQSFAGERKGEKPYKSPDSNLESMLQNQNFAEIAMHILEPKLDSWLDEHLHGLVEKIVQEEVKKLFEKR